MQVHGRGAGDLGTGARVIPGGAGNPRLDAGGHQFVIGRMKVDHVHAVAVAVVAPEYRLVLVGKEARFHQGATGQLAVGAELPVGPAAVVAANPFLQRQVAAVQVEAFQRWHLIGDFMGFGILMQLTHGTSLALMARRQKRTMARVTASSVSLGRPLSRSARAWGDNGPTSDSATAPTTQADVRGMFST